MLATRRDSALTVVSCPFRNYRFYIANVSTLVSYDVFKQASEADLAPMRISEGTIGELVPNLKPEQAMNFEIDC